MKYATWGKHVDIYEARKVQCKLTEAKNVKTYFLHFTYLDNNIHFHVVDLILEFKNLKI